MIEIIHWDWFVYVGLSPTSIPVEYRIQGGLHHSRQITIEGRVREPQSYRGKPVSVRLSPFGPEVDFGPKGRKEVGKFHRNRLGPSGPELEVYLDLPEAGLTHALIALGSIWKYLGVRVAEDSDEAAVFAYSFYAHDNPSVADLAELD